MTDDRYYHFNPETDVILFDGTYLKEGMTVLIEDTAARIELNEIIGELEARFHMWCEVSRLKIDYLAEEVHFIAVFDDGYQKKLCIPIGYAWLVKKNSTSYQNKIGPNEETIGE